jgi:hypothetical protein
MLDDGVNYIVSGLERSGTSVMMQMLHMGGLPVAFDDSRPADQHNPRGYYELAGGKIISRLMDGTCDLASNKGRIVKITAYGLKFLPKGNYKIIYLLRNIDEVLDSMQKMGFPVDRRKDRALLGKLNRFSFDLMDRRDDMEYVTVNYRDVIDNPRREIEKVGCFLGQTFDFARAIRAVEPGLYRSRPPK